MATNIKTEMRVPTRAAPKPPVQTQLLAKQFNGFSNSNDPFDVLAFNTQKKKPPPRPPPPKFTIKSAETNQEKSKKPTRPTELLTNLFGKKIPKTQPINNSISTSNHVSFNHGTFQTTQPKDGTVSLIDLSPPGSPTFTTRSSSDCVSIDSFGSDGNSNPSAFTSSSSTSQAESAFEDDFDFFGLSALNNKKASSSKNDPWKITSSQDPFGPIQSKTLNNTDSEIKVGDASFFAFNSVNNEVPSTKPTFTMPTIIRSKRNNKESTKAINAYSAKFNVESEFQTNPLKITENSNSDKCLNNDYWTDDFEDDLSPPMPQQPPPPPPREYIDSIEDGLIESHNHPYGIALYDFQASQPGDLSLRQGDMVYLIKSVNNEWIEGKVGDCQGIFPINFVDIKVPLPDLPKNIVTALYTFKAEYSEDLSFEEGARIKVLSRQSDNWLYGEYNGKKGQFPVNFVDHVPDDLPNHA